MVVLLWWFTGAGAVVRLGKSHEEWTRRRVGTYRLLLALAVLYSHAFGAVLGMNFGVVAVISFFVISGYVMKLLYSAYYQPTRDIRGFYADRALRLFPQFLFYFVLTVLLWKLLGFKSVFLTNLTAWKVVGTVTMLPLGFFMYWPEIALYVPAAWSLGLELTFYLAFPFFVMAPSAWRTAIVLASMLVAAAAFLGLIDPDIFGYRLLPGTFFIFAAGAALAARDWRLPVATALIGAGGFVIASAYLPLPYNREVFLGAAIGVAAVAILRHKRFSRLDEFLGNISYGVFLNHFILIWLCERFGLWMPLWVPSGSIALAAASYWICEHPAMLYRQRWRRERAATLAATPGRPKLFQADRPRAAASTKN